MFLYHSFLLWSVFFMSLRQLTIKKDYLRFKFTQISYRNYKPTSWWLLSRLCSFLFYWPFLMACGILGPCPEVEPMPSAVKVQSCNHWTTREFPWCIYFYTDVWLVFLGRCWPLRQEVRGKSHFY